jgi:hypothetical protein
METKSSIPHPAMDRFLYKGYWIISNPLNSLFWIEKGEHRTYISYCNNLEDR